MSHKSRPVSRHSQPGTQARGNPPVVSPLPLGAILPQQQGTRAPQPVNYYRGSSSRSPPGTATEDQPWGGTLQPTSRDYKKANEDGAHSSGAVSFSPSPHPASVVRHYPYTSPQEVFLERMERLKPKTPSGMATPIPSTPLPTRTSTNSSLQSQRPPAPPPPLPAKVVAQPTKKRPAKTKLQVEKVDRATSTQPSVALTPPKSLQSTPISATKEPRPPTVKPQERAPAPQSSPHPQERPPAPKPSSRPQERVAALAPKPPPTLQNNWLDAEANSSAATSILLDQLHSPQLRSNAFDGEGNGQSVSRQVMLAPKLQLHLNRHARGVPVIEPKQAPTATGGHPHSEDGRGPSSSYAAVRTPAKQLVPLPADDSYYDGDHEDSIVTTSPSGVLVGPSRASSRAPPAAPAYPGIFINVYDSGLVQRAPSTVRALPPPPVVAKPQPSAPAGEVPVHDSATKQSPPPAAKALPPRPVATKPPPPPREVPVAVAAPIPPRSPVSSVCSTPSAAHSAARRHLSWYRLTPYFPGLVDGHKSDEQIVRELEERLRGQQKEAPAPLPPLLTEESRVKDDAPSVLSSYRPSEHGERSLALKEEDSRAEDEAPCVVSPCPGSKSQLNCERSQPLMQEDSRTNDAPSILSSYRPSEQDERSQLLEEDARVTEEAPCILSSSRAAEQSERSVPLQVDVPVDDAPSVLASGRSSNFRDDRPLPLRQEESRVTIVTPSSGRASGYFVRPVPLKSEDSRVMETFPSFTSFQPSGNYARSIPLRPDDSRGKMLTPSAMSSARLSEQFVRPHPLQAEDCRVSHEEAAVPQLQASEYFERPLPLRQDESRVTIITPSSGRVSDRRERPLPLRSEDGRMETFPSFTSLQASEHQAAFETEDSAAPVRVVRRDEVSLCSSFADARDRHASLHEDEQLTDEERPPPPRAVTTAPKESEPERVVEEPRQVAAPVAVQDGYPINLQDDLQDDFDPVPISLHEPPPMEEALQADPWSCVAPVRSAASDAHEQLAALDDGRWFLEASGSTGRSIASTSSQGTCGSTARLRQTVRVGILADGRTSGVPLSSEMSAGPSTPKEVLWSTAALERFCAGVWLSRLAAVAPALSDLFPPTAAEEGGVGSSDHSCEYVAAESEELLRSPTYEALPRKFQGLMAAMVRQSIDVAISAKDASCDPFVLRPIDDDAMRTLRRVALDGPSGPEESEESDAFVRHCGGLNDIGNLNCIPTTVWQSSCAEPAYQLSFPQHVLHCLCTIQRAIQKKRQVMPDPSTPSEVEEHGCQVVGTAPTAEEIKQRQSWSLFMGAPRWRLEAGTMSTTSSSSFRGATGMSLMIDPAVMSDVKPMTTVATDSAWMHNVPSSTICDNSVLDRNIPTECYASMGFHSILAQQLPEVATYDRCAMLEKLKLALRWGSTAATMGESVGHPSHESRAMEWPSSSLASWMEVDVQPSTSPSQTTLWAVCRQLRRFFPSKDLSRLEHVVSALVVDLVEAGVVRCKSANGTSSEAAALQQAILVKEATEILMRALTPDNMKVSAPEQVRFAVVEGQNASYGYDGAALALHRTVVPIARLLVEERLQRLLVVVSLQHTAEMVERSVVRQSIVVEERGKQKNGSPASGDGPLDGDRTTLVPSARWSGPMGSSVTVGSVFHAMLEACVGTPFVTIGDRQRRVLVATYLRHVMLLYLQFGPNANPTSSKSRRLLEAQPEEWFPCVDAPSGTATYLGDEVNVVVKELASFCPLVASALPCV